MMGWAVTFLVVALIAAVLGFGGVAGVAVEAAKIVFFVVWAAAGLLTATILASKWEHSLGMTGAAVASLIADAIAGFVPAFLTAVVVVSWPVIRAIWWWLPEILPGAVRKRILKPILRRPERSSRSGLRR